MISMTESLLLTCVQSERCGSDHFRITVHISEDTLVHTDIRGTKVGDLKVTDPSLTTKGRALSDGNPTITNQLLSIPNPHH